MTTKQYRQLAEASARTAAEKENAAGANRGAGAKQNNGRRNFTPEGLPPVNLGWRSELAARVPAFRLHACYDVHSDARRVRRALERLARKTKLKGGK